MSLYETRSQMHRTTVLEWITAGGFNSQEEIDHILAFYTDEELVGMIMEWWTVDATEEELLATLADYRIERLGEPQEFPWLTDEWGNPIRDEDSAYFTREDY
jgi:hypothetical protein